MNGAQCVQGTEVVLLNGHEEEQVKGNLKRLGRFQNVAVRHICGNPLHREDLKKVGPHVMLQMCAGMHCHGTSPSYRTTHPDSAKKAGWCKGIPGISVSAAWERPTARPVSHLPHAQHLHYDLGLAAGHGVAVMLRACCAGGHEQGEVCDGGVRCGMAACGVRR